MYKLAVFQKGLTGFQKFFSFRVPMNPLQAWEAKLEGAHFLGVHKNTADCIFGCSYL